MSSHFARSVREMDELMNPRAHDLDPTNGSRCRTKTHGHECQRPATRWVSAPGILKHRCCDYHARVWAANAYAEGKVTIDPPLENDDADVQAEAGRAD